MKYRFLCCSDTQGQPPPPLDETGATAWLHAGNVYGGWARPAMEPRNPLDDLPQPDLAGWGSCVGVGEWLRRPVPVYAVRGNNDVSDLHGFFWKCDDLTAAVRRVGENLLIAGVGWSGEQSSDLPTDADLRPACNVVAREAQRLSQSGDRLVILSHYPPHFVSSDSGYGSIRELVFDLRPAVIVAGHRPEYFGRTERMEVPGGYTLAVHPGPAGGVLHVDTATGTALWQTAIVRKAG